MTLARYNRMKQSLLQNYAFLEDLKMLYEYSISVLPMPPYRFVVVIITTIIRICIHRIHRNAVTVVFELLYYLCLEFIVYRFVTSIRS